MFGVLLSVVLLGSNSKQPFPKTPPMGWNSYDAFGFSVTEKDVMANAEYEAKNLKKFGWNYCVIDYLWSMPPRDPLGTHNQSDDFLPRLSMDAYGRLLPDPEKFPSSVKGVGFKSIADRLHRMGLLFGIHLMRGIPRQAVAANTPVFGTSFTAAEAADKNSPCPWCNQMFGVNMSGPAGQAYLDSLFKLYASWGVDFVKVDDMSNPYHREEIAGYEKAIADCGRPIVLSLSPGETPLDASFHVTHHANMWRLLGDLWDNWPELNHAFDVIANWTPYRSEGRYPDPDMLPLGKLRVQGPNTGPPNTVSRFSVDEARSLMTLWCIAQCPLMFGGDLTQTDQETLALITNPDLIALDQTATDGKQLEGGEQPVWVAHDKSRNAYVALFNRTDQVVHRSFTAEDYMESPGLCQNVWTGEDMSSFQGATELDIPAHGCVLIKIGS